MNDHTRKIMASSELEILKEAVLLVLYQQHKDESQPSIVTLGEIRERLGLPRGSSGQNYLIRGILEILGVDGVVARNYLFDAGGN